MNYKRLEHILLLIIIIVVSGVYLYTVAPTFSFWDCGEFIASSYTLAVPHPPGSPLFLIFGRVWLMVMGIIASIPLISKDAGWQMNLLCSIFSVLSAVLVYKIILKIIRLWKTEAYQLNGVIVAFATTLLVSFSYTFWWNALETEIYSIITCCFLFLNYLVLLWYEGIPKGITKNNYLFLSFYLVFLFTGIQLMPFMLVIPLYIFIIFVERKYSRDWLLTLFCIFQIILFMVMFIWPVTTFTIILLVLPVLLGIVLILNDPSRYRNWRFFLAGIFLVLIAVSTEFYLPIRSKCLTRLYKDERIQKEYLTGKNIAPRINECEPGEGWDSFMGGLHRSQYGPQRIMPRQTQDETGYSLIEGYFRQMAMYIRYLSQQPLPENTNKFLRGIILALFYLLGCWGIVEFYRRDKKLFLFMVLIMFMLSFSIVGYLNMKFSPSDANPKHQPREVRERDYFFQTGFVYFYIFIGLGSLGFVDWLKKETRHNKFVHTVGLTGVVAFSIIPFFANIRINNRYKNFTPRDYGYNMLVSCDDNGIIFTNGDNDTFPLWYVQEVLGIKRSVIVANLSLINTDWYIRQLKYWGAPISFSEYIIKRLAAQGYFVTKDRKILLLKDIMIREILATNTGIELKDEDYFTPQEEFAKCYLKGYRGKRTIYFATTVDSDNYKGFMPYLRLEGIVYRVVGDSLSPLRNLDVERTKNFFYKVYRYTGVFECEKHTFLSNLLYDFKKRKNEGEFYDYKVLKDENTRRLYSNYVAGLAALGVELMERGDIQGTLNAWRFSLLFDIEPKSQLLFNVGIAFTQTGMLDSAEHYFLKIDTKDYNIVNRIGGAYMNSGYYDKAIEYFQKAITINRMSPTAYMGLLRSYLAKKDTNSAGKILRDWLTLNPRDSSAYNILKQLGQ